MNLLHNLPEDLQEEVLTTIVKTKDMTLKRIVSKGHVTPEGKWYDQNQNEWVMLLTGSAQLLFADETTVLLRPGDHIIIPAHKRHRVAKTDTCQETIWLALHYK